MTEPATSTSSLPSDSVSKLSLSPSPSAKMTTTNEITVSVVPDWSLLPVELLHIISKNLDDCFDALHARSVCTLWRSIFPFPSHLSRPSYTLPTLDNKGSWSLERIPLFLFRPRALAASEYFLGGIRRDEEPREEEELPSPMQCTVKVEIPGSSDRRLMNMKDCQILPLGHQYRMIGCNAREYRNVVVLPLNQEGGGDFVVLLNFTRVIFVFRSAEMRWRRLQPFTEATCEELFTFRGKFYAIFISGEVFAFDPHFLELTPLKPLELPNCGSSNELVQSGDDELFLVETILPRNDDVLSFNRLTLRVCRLDVEAGQWVVVTDIGDRVLIIGDLGNVSFSAKELPDCFDASEYFLGGIRRYEPEEEEEELPSPIQCTVKVEIPGSDPKLMKMNDCQILPLGHQYRMIGCNAKEYRNVVVLPLNQEGGGGDFVVLLNFTKVLLVYRSTEMRWRRLHTQPFTTATCEELFTFRGKFYAIFISGDVFAFDPHFLGLTTLKPLELPNCGSCNDLVQSGDDELFLVEKIIPRNDDVLDFNRLALRVCRLDVEAGHWVVVTDIGDRVFIIGEFGSVSCSAKEFPEGCGVSGNSILYTHKPWNETYFYKYGVDTGREEDDLNCWWYSRDNLVTILSTSPVVALRVEREAMDRT